MALNTEAAALVERLAQAVTGETPLGLMSVSIYDTAWVSMVSKIRGGQRDWLFPESFTVLLDSQGAHGGWEHQAFSDVDGILNTMAALLAMLWHKKDDCQQQRAVFPTDIQSRINNAVAWLAHKLSIWDAAASEQVGFEVLVPSLLSLLAREGITFQYPGSELLLSLRGEKLSRFKPELLYGATQTTLIHSLEAFIGMINFDKVRHHMVAGSMLASPSSTAAYLISASTWDDEAEGYLRRVAKFGQGRGGGGFPSAFPTSIFEASWVLSILLESGFRAAALGQQSVHILSSFLENTLAEQKGTVGFAPKMISDADDTAKSILTLRLLGRDVDLETMIANFDSTECFCTYRAERNPSFSANCNILTALLHAKAPDLYGPHVMKVVKFLCDSWNTGTIKDKWNTSYHYSTMLLTQAFCTLLRQWAEKRLPCLPNSLISDRISIVLTQILTKTVQEQATSGSWGTGCCEITAYAVLTVACLVHLPWTGLLESRARSALERGKQFLGETKQQWTRPSYIWIEKVTYSSALLSQIYCLAAMNVKLSSYPRGTAMRDITNVSAKTVTGFSHFFSGLPIFSQQQDAPWTITASLIESFLVIPYLQRDTLRIFPRDEKAEKAYLEYIPFTWTGCKSLGRKTSHAVLLDMMILSMLNFQADAYMETIVAETCQKDIQLAIDILTQLYKDHESPESIYTASYDRHSFREGSNVKSNILNKSENRSADTQTTPAAEILHVLSRFISYILHHPAVSQSPSTIQAQLHDKLFKFLFAHITQIQDNIQLATTTTTPPLPDAPTQPHTSHRTYYDWVHTTSADHTSCPYSFVFFTCLISKPGEACFQNVRQKYLAQDLCRHLATLCRQYNDYGSVLRDREEGNLNSVDFSEFDREPGQKKKAEVLWLAEYERECLENTFAKLKSELVGQPAVVDSLRLFVDVTDLYGQIYFARDINRPHG